MNYSGTDKVDCGQNKKKKKKSDSAFLFAASSLLSTKNQHIDHGTSVTSVLAL